MADTSDEAIRALPRLLYMADVPAEASYHGSALVYRLLQRYPANKLVMVERSFQRSLPDRRLANVRYEELRENIGRFLTTRFHRLAASWLTLSAELHVRRVPPLLGTFQPQAVLTVAHGFSWLTASAFAERHQLPLHLIIHDDWAEAASLMRFARRRLRRRFGAIYRHAASRFCVSPYMAEEFERRYGVKGTVLYPSRETGAPTFDARPDGKRGDRPFTLAFAGTLATGDYVRQLVALSWMLPSVRGRLLLFGPFDFETLSTAGMNMKVTVVGGTLHSLDLITRLRAEADVLFLPMSFEPQDSCLFALNFPSKLTDYTAAALPILIWGPKESSAVKWAAGEPGVAAVVTDSDERVMAALIAEIAQDLPWRQRLSEAAARAGKKYFSPERAETVFYQALSSDIA
jgi:glycosyltransferase involved in cell wall biosynthesis